ncbi:rhodanese-like domain-containing protein 4, chloroplastic [Typha angustifolia]|uniref:rhodanese-like domain-containing protein 4, chloroplastic n=1 Tax=Typha angustifolia TaxID=59011 RepID=UPI003C2BA39D
MEVLSAAGLTPVSLLKTTSSSEKRPEPRKIIPLSFPKTSSSDDQLPSLRKLVPKSFGQGLAALSLALGNGGLARALTYEEALGQSINSDSSFSGSLDFDIGEILDGFLKFTSENPLVIGGGVAVLAVPLVLLQILPKPKPWGVKSAKNAYSMLAEDASAQLLDIRGGREFKDVGSPDIRGLKKKAVSVSYRGDDDQRFLKKLALKFKDPGSTTLFILDKFDGNSEFVAELVTAYGFKAAFAIKDGVEGTQGWMNSGLPWSPPKKGLNVNFSDLKDAVASALGDGSNGLPVSLGLAAATGLGIFAFTETETVLQLLGSAAIIQLVTKKLLFAEDRKVTLQQVDEFLNTKVAPKELVDEIKMIGKTLLPASSSVVSLPAPANKISDASTSSTPVQKTDAVLEAKTEVQEEAKDEPLLEVNSVPKAELGKESLPVTPRPLSPYPYYPDFKPPSSPSPSPP